MNRIAPLPLAALDAETRAALAFYEQAFGYIPEPLRVLARKPALLRAVCALADAVQGQAAISFELRMLIATVASQAHGCRYCQAHGASLAHAAGASTEKVRAVWEFETSTQFSARERAALRYAWAAAAVPNAVTDELFAALRAHFSDDEILEITAQVAFMGWWNRFNDSLESTLEARPREFCEAHLSAVGWDLGKHTDVSG